MPDLLYTNDVDIAHIVPDDVYFLVLGMWKQARKKAKTVDEVKACDKMIRLLVLHCPEYRPGMKFDDDIRLF